jgi:PAS domain S-box-containing protein
VNDSIFLVLVQNAALLLSIAFLFDLAALRWPLRQPSLRQVPFGLVLGAIGIALMLTPWQFTPGIIFDTRSVLLGISGLFFGSIPTLIAMALTAAFRLSQGGAAAWAGVSVILATGSMGIVWRHLRRRPLAEIGWVELYLFGIVLHITMLGLMLTLPRETALNVLSAISLPVLVIYPIGTTLLGLLMINRLRHEQTAEKLRESEERLRLAVGSANIGFFDRDLQTQREYYSPEWQEQIGYTVGELSDDVQEWQSRIHPDDLAMVLAKNADCIQGRRPNYEAEYRLRHKDGSYRWILARGLIHFNEDGQAVRLLGCHIDVTQRKQNADTISASERRFRGLAESSQDYIMLYDRECRHVYENPAALRVAGHIEANIIGKTHREAGFSEEMSAQWEADIQQVFATGNSTQRLFEWDGVDGKVFLDWRLSPVLGPDGKVELVLGISRDITPLKQIEQALQKSEAQYRVLTENIKDVVWVLDTETMYFRYVSPSVMQLRGYTSEEILAVSVDYALTPEAREYLHNLIHSRVEAFLSGQEPPNKFYADEVEQPCKDGSTVWTEAVTTYYRNPDNGRVEVRGVTRDISERKRAEEALHASEIKFRQIYEQSMIGISIINLQGQFLDGNPAVLRLLGYTLEEYTHLSIRQISHPEDTERDLTLYQEMWEGKREAFIMEKRNLHKDGHFVWGMLTCTLVRDTDGQPQFSIGMFEDITDRKLAEQKIQATQTELQRLLTEADRSRRVLLNMIEDQKKAEEQIRQLNTQLEQRVHDRTAQLEAANHELEAFAYSVSHDLRAPLRAIEGFSAALMDDYFNQLDETARHYLTRTQEAARRMGQLINDLLGLSRVTRTEFNRQEVNLSALAQEIAGELQTQDPQRQVIFEISPDLIVQGDTHLLKIMLENLLSNAFKFTNRRERARIEVGMNRQSGDRVYFVRDNGAGFDMAYATKLFGPFQRLHGAEEFPGTGIGLVIVQRIIARHGGRIWPEAAVDQGATFYFTL